MTQFTHNPHPPHGRFPQQPIIIQQRPKRTRHRVRGGWIVLLAVGLGILILLFTTGIPFIWSDVIEFASISDAKSFTALALLAGGLVALTLLAKALRGRGRRRNKT